MHILVEMRTGHIMTREVERADTVCTLKAKFFDEIGAVPDKQSLIFNYKLLFDEDSTLADYGIRNDFISWCMPGC
jgi:hypothetical protein